MKVSDAAAASADVVDGSEQALRRYVAEISAAYLSNAQVRPADVPGVILQIAETLARLDGAAPAEAQAPPSHRATAAQIKASVSPDWLVSFENGQRYKTLKRHLTERGLTPASYRLKWGLPVDYPMVAPSFHAKRSALSKSLQLGQKGALSLARRREAKRR